MKSDTTGMSRNVSEEQAFAFSLFPASLCFVLGTFFCRTVPLSFSDTLLAALSEIRELPFSLGMRGIFLFKVAITAMRESLLFLPLTFINKKFLRFLPIGIFGIGFGFSVGSLIRFRTGLPKSDFPVAILVILHGFLLLFLLCRRFADTRCRQTSTALRNILSFVLESGLIFILDFLYYFLLTKF